MPENNWSARMNYSDQVPCWLLLIGLLMSCDFRRIIRFRSWWMKTDWTALGIKTTIAIELVRPNG